MNLLSKLPLLEYANNATYLQYPLSWAPHHLGVWPIADLPWYLQEQMPMEETANFLMMLAAIAHVQIGAGTRSVETTPPPQLQYLTPYWPLIQIWGNYLMSSLPDPGDQLCTDDFEGPSPHNVNLAAKGIVGLAAYSQLQAWFGDSAGAEHSMAMAQSFVQQWMSMGIINDLSHSRHTLCLT